MQGTSWRELAGEPQGRNDFFFRLGHITELIVLGQRMSSVAADKFSVVVERVWKSTLISSKQPFCSSTQVLIHWFNSFNLCSESSEWNFCHYKYATHQTLSFIVFCGPLELKSTVWSSSTISKWWQSYYSPIPLFEISRFGNLSSSSSCGEKKLRAVTGVTFFHPYVTSCKISFVTSCKISFSTM